MTEIPVQVGRIRDRPYFILVRAEPSLDDIEEFAAVLFYEDPDREERVEIARIDQAHGFTHVDRIYSEQDDKEEFDGGVWEAQRYLEENWERFASLHRENHE